MKRSYWRRVCSHGLPSNTSRDTQELHSYSASPHYDGLTISNTLEEPPAKQKMAAGATDRSTCPVPPLPIKLSAECDSIDSFPTSNDYEPVGGFTKLSVGSGEDQYVNVSAPDDESIYENAGGETQL